MEIQANITKKNCRSRHPGRIFALLIIFFSLFSFHGRADNGVEVVITDWLKITDPGILRHWEYFIEGDARQRIRFRSRRWPSRSGTLKRILVLLSKPSSSYDSAITIFLEMFFQESRTAEFLVVNYGGIYAKGRDALAEAERNGFHLILAVGSVPTDLVSRAYGKGKIPVVTAICKDPYILGHRKSYGKDPGSNIAYTSLNIPVNMQLQYLKILEPNLKNIGLLYNINHKQVMKTEIKPARAAFKADGIHVIDIRVTHVETAPTELRTGILRALTRMRRSDPGLENSLFWISSCTAVFTHIDVVNCYSRHVPVLASIPNVVKPGDDSAVIAFGIDRRNNARLAAMYALRILNGSVAPGDLEIGIISPPDLSINFKVAKKINLKIPFFFVESATSIYDHEGKTVKDFGREIK